MTLPEGHGHALTIAETRDIALCRLLRRTVLIDEQGVPEADAIDTLDDTALHLLAIWHGAPVGTARPLLPAGPHAATTAPHPDKTDHPHKTGNSGKTDNSGKTCGPAKTDHAAKTDHPDHPTTTAKIGRVCVLAQARGEGIGAALIHAAVARLRQFPGMTTT